MVDLFVLVNVCVIISTNFKTLTGIYPSCITKLILDFPNVKPKMESYLYLHRKSCSFFSHPAKVMNTYASVHVVLNTLP